MSLAKRQHEERESVSSLFLCVKRKNLKSELNFCSNKLTDSTLASPRTFRVAMVSAPTLPKFQAYRLRIYVVYTSYFLRTLLFLPYLPHSPSLPFSRIFFLFYMIYSWNFSRIFFRSIQYICSIFLEIFLEFFQNFFLYILYMSWFFLEFFSVSPIKLPKIFLPIQYICSSFLEFFPLYIVYLQYICSIYVVVFLFVLRRIKRTTLSGGAR